MRQLLGGEERAGLLQIFQNGFVGFVIAQSGKFAGFFGLVSAVVHRDQRRQFIAAAGDVIVGAETAGGVHASGAAIHGDVIGNHHKAIPIQKRVLRGHVFKVLPLERSKNLPILNAGGFHGLFAKRLGKNIGFAVLGARQHVAFHRVQGNCLVAGKRPACCRPNDEIGFGKIANARKFALVVLDAELDIDGGAGVGLILDFRLGKRGFIVGAPVNRLHALIDIAAAIHFAKHLDLARLKRGVHGQIGVLPIRRDAQPLELLHLFANKVGGELMAGVAELGNGHFFAVQFILLDDGGFNGHAVVIPTRIVGHMEARHGFGFVDDVFEDLVHRRSHVDIPVGERRSVMDVEQRFPGAVFLQQIVKFNLLPVFQHSRLPLGQVCTHGKLGGWQVQGACVIFCHFH